MERRIVQKTGGSTYIVSLPKSWAEGRIEEGDRLYIEEEEDSLRIHLQEKSEERESILEYEEPLDGLLRKVIAHYVVGYDRIKIRSGDVIRKKDEIGRLVREKLIGLEITKESSGEIMLQNLLKYSDLPTGKLLLRMNSILKTMYKDLLSSFGNGEDVLKDVMKRENEVDRLYLLGVRQLRGAIKDDRVRDKLGIDSRLRCLSYRIVLKSLERIGDHLKKISSLLVKSEGEVPQRGKLEEVGRKSLEVYEGVMESLFKFDGDLAERNIEESKEIDDLFAGMNREVRKDEGHFVLKSIMNSLDRTRKLSRDIAEIVINLSAGK